MFGRLKKKTIFEYNDINIFIAYLVSAGYISSSLVRSLMVFIKGVYGFRHIPTRFSMRQPGEVESSIKLLYSKSRGEAGQQHTRGNITRWSVS